MVSNSYIYENFINPYKILHMEYFSDVEDQYSIIAYPTKTLDYALLSITSPIYYTIWIEIY